VAKKKNLPKKEKRRMKLRLSNLKLHFTITHKEIISNGAHVAVWMAAETSAAEDPDCTK
jgi:hypothetical protein